MTAPVGTRIVTLRGYFQSEVDAAYIYASLARAEMDPSVREVYQRLAASETGHATFWQARLVREGVRDAKMKPSCRAWILALIARYFGPSSILPYLARIEVAESHVYDGEPDAVAAGMSTDEYGHARIVQAAAMAAGGLSGKTLAVIEGRRRGNNGNALRAAVLGANDGLVSNLSLVMGVVGAMVGERAILLTGIAGLTAGACSMAMGEWLSVSSAREMARRAIAAQSVAIAETPELEKQDLAVIYQAKGLDAESARQLVDKLFQSPADALDSMSREKLGIDPTDLGGSPWSAAAASFGLFALGAIFPVLPFFILQGSWAFAASFALSALALLGIGAATSLFTGRKMAFSALRQLAIGLAAALVTFLLGHLIGVSIN
jgi:VIT1/CCC1 family predicted Fe2+/Mn2+ transporter